MSPAEQIQQSIDQLRQQGYNSQADEMQSKLDNHQNLADVADFFLKVKQQNQLKSMGL
jgi:hypothetical protein